MDRDELEAVKDGRTRDALVPVGPGESLAVGDTVTFAEATYDSLAEILLVPQGERIPVESTEAINQESRWAGHDLYRIAWNPVHRKKRPKPSATGGSR